MVGRQEREEGMEREGERREGEERRRGLKMNNAVLLFYPENLDGREDLPNNDLRIGAIYLSIMMSNKPD